MMPRIHAARKAFLADFGGYVLENRVHLYVTWLPNRRAPGSMRFITALRQGHVERSFREEENAKLLREFRGRLAGIRSGMVETGLSGRPLSSGELVQRIRKSLAAGGSPPKTTVTPRE